MVTPEEVIRQRQVLRTDALYRAHAEEVRNRQQKLEEFLGLGPLAANSLQRSGWPGGELTFFRNYHDRTEKYGFLKFRSRTVWDQVDTEVAAWEVTDKCHFKDDYPHGSSHYGVPVCLLADGSFSRLSPLSTSWA